MKTYKEFFKALLHPGPLTTIILIKTITLSVIYCSLMWWPPHESLGGLISLTTFLVSSGMVMFNFFSAIFNGPGYLPPGWEPKNPEAKEKLQFCTVCKGYKAPRAHHCRKCGHCVLKLDHHCPWINSCVGHYNHAYFVFFLFSAMIGCSHATVVLSCSLYRALYRTHFLFEDGVPMVYLGINGFLWCLLSCGGAVGVALGVSVLLYYQLKVIFRNETTIEEWIVEKANYRRILYSDGEDNVPPFKNPYDLGSYRANWNQAISLSCRPVGNGVDFRVAKGCSQYDMTVEQILQKQDKRRRTRECLVVNNYSGSWFPITKGLQTCIRFPCSDEPRIKVSKGERLLVSRHKKFWVYGELLSESEGNRRKGWLPKSCVIEILSARDSTEDVEDDAEVNRSSKKQD